MTYSAGDAWPGVEKGSLLATMAHTANLLSAPSAPNPWRMKSMPDIPRKIAFRVIAYALAGRSRELGERANDSIKRRGVQAVNGTFRKAPLHREPARDVLDQSFTIEHCIIDPKRYTGPDLPAELVDNLCALAAGYIQVMPEIRRIAEQIAGPRAVGNAHAADLPKLLSRLLDSIALWSRE